MIRRSFKYNKLLGLFVLAVLLALIYIGGILGGEYFDFFSSHATNEYLQSDDVRTVFVLLGAIAAIFILFSLSGRRLT